MGVDIDETRRHDPLVRVNRRVSLLLERPGILADMHDAVALDDDHAVAQVAMAARLSVIGDDVRGVDARACAFVCGHCPSLTLM